MRSGKKTTPFLCLLTFAVFVLGFFGLNTKARAQADDLMIVEYVDWNVGSAVAIKIFNPTPTAKNLSNYKFRIHSNGSATNIPTDEILSGIIPPNGTRIIANDTYSCTADLTNNSQGVNGNEVVAITTLSNTVVDMIGRVGYTGTNNQSQTVNNIPNALYQNRIVRTPCNVARYTLSSGTYNPNNFTTANIWPNNQTANVTGWTVLPATCIPQGWNAIPLAVNAGADQTFTCRQQSIALNAIVSPGATVLWSGGKGTFSNPTGASTIYTPSPLDFTQLKLKITASLSPCPNKEDFITIINGDSTTIPLYTDNRINICPEDSILLTTGSATSPVIEWFGNGKGLIRNKNASITYYIPVANDHYALKFFARYVGPCATTNIAEISVQNGRDTLANATGFTFAPQNPKINEAVTFSYATARPQTDHYGTWNFGNGATLTNVQGAQQQAFAQPGTYNVTVNVLDAFGCARGTFKQQVTVTDPVQLLIPNIFTPNNDGINDTFKPQLPATTAYDLKIFNRWGQLVFESTEPAKVWDGTDATDGVYFVYLNATYTTGETISVKNPVTIVR